MCVGDFDICNVESHSPYSTVILVDIEDILGCLDTCANNQYGICTTNSAASLCVGLVSKISTYNDR